MTVLLVLFVSTLYLDIVHPIANPFLASRPKRSANTARMVGWTSLQPAQPSPPHPSDIGGLGKGRW